MRRRREHFKLSIFSHKATSKFEEKKREFEREHVNLSVLLLLSPSPESKLGVVKICPGKVKKFDVILKISLTHSVSIYL